MSSNLRYRFDLASLLETTVGPVLTVAEALPGAEASGVQVTGIEIAMPVFPEVRLERATGPSLRAVPRTRFRLPSSYSPLAGRSGRLRLRISPGGGGEKM